MKYSGPQRKPEFWILLRRLVLFGLRGVFPGSFFPSESIGEGFISNGFVLLSTRQHQIFECSIMLLAQVRTTRRVFFICRQAPYVILGQMSDIIGHRREGFLTHFGKWFQKMQFSELPEIACSAARGVREGVQKNKNSSGDGPKTSFFASEIAGAAAPASWAQITKISLYSNTAEMYCFPKMAILSGFRCTSL